MLGFSGATAWISMSDSEDQTEPDSNGTDTAAHASREGLHRDVLAGSGKAPAAMGLADQPPLSGLVLHVGGRTACRTHHYGCDCRQQYVAALEQRMARYRNLLEEVQVFLVADLPVGDLSLDRLAQRIRAALDS